MSDKALQVLLDAGIPANIAQSMMKALEPKKTKAKKKRFYGTYTKRERINVPIVVVSTCQTCGSSKSFKRVMSVFSDETDVEQTCIVGLCENCIPVLQEMSKDELISVILLENHKDIELNRMPLKSHIKLAPKKTPLEWLTHTVNSRIAGPKPDDEGFVDGLNVYVSKAK